MTEWYADLLHRCDQFHAFSVGDRAALDDGHPTNPYAGHNADLAFHWDLGFRGFPFPARETETRHA